MSELLEMPDPPENPTDPAPSPASSDEPAPPTDISEAKLRANRANSLASTGPKTPEGKRRSSLNAYRSGLHSQIVCNTAEELVLFTRHVEEVLAEHEPYGATEKFLAVSIAENMWRLQRARAIESAIFADGFRDHVDSIESGHPEVDTALAVGKTWEDQHHALCNLTVYEGRIRRALEKDTARLVEVQSHRRFLRTQAQQQATLLMEHAESQGKTYDPGEDFKPVHHHGGFVFSRDLIVAEKARKLRLFRAEKHREDAAAGRKVVHTGPGR